MDDKYWASRYDGKYKEDKNRDFYVKTEGELDIKAFDAFVSKYRFFFPEAYVEFLKKYNGMEVDRKVYTVLKNGAKFDGLTPLVLPFGQAEKIFDVLCQNDLLKYNYFPVAVLSASPYSHCFLIKGKNRNRGKIYYFDKIMSICEVAFDTIEEFFKALDININL